MTVFRWTLFLVGNFCGCLLLAASLAAVKPEEILGSSSDCILNAGGKFYDFRPLRRWNPWNLTLDRNGTLIKFEISICDDLKSQIPHDPCSGGTICMTTGKERRQLTSFKDALYGLPSATHSGLTLLLDGNICPAVDHELRMNTSALLDFRCHKTLGFPTIQMQFSCFLMFTWSTSAACPQPIPRQEVPCSTHDLHGQFYDLSPLIKPVGGYQVETSNQEDSMYINVCADIATDDSQSSLCPNNTSSCLIRGSKVMLSSTIITPLQVTEHGLQLTYQSPTIEAGCSTNSTTVIDFLCPKKGKGTRPKLILNADCFLSILWETDYACPTTVLNGNLSSCSFDKSIHGVTIDLSPLRKLTGEQPYKVSAKVNGLDQDFYLNVCGGLGTGFICGNRSWSGTNTVCLKDQANQAEHVLGTNRGSALRLIDGSLSLNYLGDFSCPDGMENHLSTFINFACDKNAENNGLGLPKFAGKQGCQYSFDWPTKLACFEERTLECALEKGPIHLNFNKFRRSGTRTSWRAIDGTSHSGQSREIFFNLCGAMPIGEAAKCGQDSAICLIEKDKTLSLGKVDLNYVSYRLQNDSHLYDITFSNGSPCELGKISSHVSLKCSPNSFSTSPVLIKESPCFYDFEWRTAAACPETPVQFDNCIFKDSNSGVIVDLNPLHSNTFYPVETEAYIFQINVCGPVKGTNCNLQGMNLTRGCQTEKNSAPGGRSRAFNLGQDPLSFAHDDGELINMTFTGGTPYNDPKRTNRSMSITFVCDPEAGNGKPQFIGEANRAYGFLWRTSLVCSPAKSAEQCIVTDATSKKQYDLSTLMKNAGEDDWSVLWPGMKKKFYLNVCRPLSKPRACFPQSAACLVDVGEEKEETTSVANLGQAIKEPILSSEGHIQLHYTLGEPCTSYGKETNYSVTISFICRPKSLGYEGPRFLAVRGTCNYSFLWSTQSACAVGVEEQRDCRYTDPDSGLTYDLNPLYKNSSFYEVTGGNGMQFQLNLCGPVGSNGCLGSNASDLVTACKLDGSGRLAEVLGLNDTTMVNYFKGQAVRLSAHGKEDDKTRPEVEFIFECDASALKPVVKYLRKENPSIYFFSVSTVLVCKLESSDCKELEGRDGHSYDLSLLLNNSHWTTTSKHKQYYVSVCGGLVGVGGPSCHNQGACILDGQNQNAGQSLGERSESYVTEDRTIIVKFTNGFACPGTDKNSSAILILKCSTLQRELVLLNISPECEHLFELDTPAACPVETFTGSDCTVVDKVYDNVFNLSLLNNKIKNEEVYGENGNIFHINVCGDLNRPPSGCQGSAVCQTNLKNSSFSLSFGKPNSKLSYRDGLIQLKYTDEQSNCQGQFPRTTLIEFVCDHSATSVKPTILEEDGCSVSFLWPTVHACPAHEVTSCFAQDDSGNSYDLSSLSLPDDNYIIRNPQNPKEKFVINICRTIVHRKESLCPNLAAACLITAQEKNRESRARSLGTNMKPPWFEGGVLKLRYPLGDGCRQEGTFLRFMETVVEFKCEETAKGSQPEFISFENCIYNFIWFTPAACPSGKQEMISGNCSVTNPISGHIFDFSSLNNENGFKVQTSPNHQFMLNICGPLKESFCGKGVGSCQIEMGGEKRAFKAGQANAEVHYRNGNLYLNYSDGEKCHGGRYLRNTIIQFVCDGGKPAGESTVAFLSESHDCSYLFNWHTKLACEGEGEKGLVPVQESPLNCSANTLHGLVDLSPLSYNGLGHHLISLGNDQLSGVYMIHICGFLEANFNFQMGISAGCKFCFGKPTLNLGIFNSSPFVEKDQILLRYTNGSVCPQNEAKTMSSKVIFICNLQEEVEMELLGTGDDECELVFEVQTYLVCPKQIEACEIGDKEEGFHLDFKNFNSLFKVNSGKDQYELSMCQPVSQSGPCTGAGVCLTNEHKEQQSYGLVANASVFHNGIHMTLVYESQDNCTEISTGTHTRRSEIKFYCNPAAGLGKPVIYKKFLCNVIFTWATAEVCSSKQPVCTLWNAPKDLFDLRVLSSLSHSWNTTDSQGNIYWLNLCREVHKGAVMVAAGLNSSCPSYGGACYISKGSGGKGISLGSIFTQRLFMDAASKSLVLTYNHGDPCPVKRSSTDLDEDDEEITNFHWVASTEVRFKCGRHMGTPQFLSGPDSKECKFKFQWETSLACPEMQNIPIKEIKGVIYDLRLNYAINMTHIFESPRMFYVDDINREERYVYVINLGQGVGSNLSSPDCNQAAICQTKPDGTFYRDIGSVMSRKFFLRGSELQMILSSYGRKCGKNKYKNVTTVINFQCSSHAGLGRPKFLYESGNCDYLFEWETSSVCPQFGEVPFSFHQSNDSVTYKKSVLPMSTSAILTISLLILLASIIVILLAKKERRTAFKSKVKGCFQKVHIPQYRYVQCYFLRLRRNQGDSTLLRGEGETVLLSPDDPLPRYPEDSDAEAMT